MVDSILQSKLGQLPRRPGVYLMRDDTGEVLYVGKAKSLRSRVRSYFSTASTSLKTRELLRRTADVETIVVDSEAEALILENNLIKENQPRFNISLRDDKTYPYIKVTVQEAFPRVLVTRRVLRDGARYFGPYTDVRRMRHALDLVKKLYTVRSCHYALPTERPSRPCLDYHIGRCRAPCVMLQSQEEYREMIGELLDVLSGNTRGALARLGREMAVAAADLQFERAAQLRDTRQHLEALEARQKVVDLAGGDRDVIGFARNGKEACAVVLRIREGKLLGRQPLFFSNLDDEPDEEVLRVATTQYYVGAPQGETVDLPGEILLPADFPDRDLLEAILHERAGHRTQTHVPRRGEKTRLVALAAENAHHLLDEHVREHGGRMEPAEAALQELRSVLSLPTLPRRITCFDVSHTQGADTVASAIVFEEGEPRKSEYRRFRINGGWGNDDLRSMQEVVGRYFRRRIDEGRPQPDLVLIDGGKGQLSAAKQALDEIGLAQQPLVSLAKREEELFVPGNQQAIRLPRASAALRLLQRIRDEAHRFAITYNRNLRKRRTIGSQLSEIPGIGPARRQALLEHFGSLRAVSNATEEEIARLPGFSTTLAEQVLRHTRALCNASEEKR